MKKSVYILIIVFLTYGKGFANSADFLTVFGVNSVENDLCEIRSRSCFDNTYLIHSESKKHTHCAKLFYSYEEMKTFGMASIYDTPTDSFESNKTTNYIPFVAAGSEYVAPINLKFKRLQNLNLENYMSQPINPSYSKGFGVRLGL